MNPYEPPIAKRNDAPLWRRIRIGAALASAEYRRGLQRENITVFQHFRAWLALLFLLWVAFIIVQSFGGLLLELIPNVNFFNID